jgi:hypothetical protein
MLASLTRKEEASAPRTFDGDFVVLKIRGVGEECLDLFRFVFELV